MTLRLSIILLFLLLGFTGMIDLLGFGAIANGAHLGGLMAGMTMGFIGYLAANARSGQAG